DRDIFQNFVFVLKATGWTNADDIKTQVYKVLDEVDMKHKKKAKPHELSGGEKQRIALARAILNKPEIILADEPTGNLDSESSIYVTNKLFELSKQNTAVIFVTHDNSLQNLVPAAKKIVIEDKKLITID
ncbi:MAG: ATP-binding cassette domain-containing protein, partial [Bacteroidota bacterium]|nr:ATP-binding cassette domain-containing protein [Bacteroidota bacterium]